MRFTPVWLIWAPCMTGCTPLRLKYRLSDLRARDIDDKAELKIASRLDNIHASA
jgi:hypothetical protein